MKKVISFILALLLLCSGVGLQVFAAGSTKILLSPSASIVRIGDTITITGSFDGSMIGVFDILIKYNADQLNYVSTIEIPPVIEKGELSVEASKGSIQLLYLDEDGGNTGIKKGSAFKMSFKVIGGEVGDKILVSTQIKTVGDANVESMSATATSASMTLADPLNTNSFLSSMIVGDTTISPAFNKNTTTYSASVPFSVTRIEVNAKSEDSKAKVTISGQNLSVGTNRISIVVTAENGSKKTYSINVTREQNPDYKASNNANIKSITPSIGILSPVFDPAKTLYNVYLPYEITEFDATGEMVDQKATGVQKEKISIIVGDNSFVITGIAEDGTKKDYTIIVTRMPAQGESMPDPTINITPTISNDEKNTFILFGTLVDGNDKPLANMTIELHSNIMATTTDANGFYKFENVTMGNHILYIKDQMDSELTNMTLSVSRSNKTLYKEGNLTIEGNVKLDLKLKDSKLEVIAAVKENPIEKQGSSKTGMPWWGILLIAIASVALGFIIRPLLSKPIYIDEDDSAGIIM